MALLVGGLPYAFSLFIRSLSVCVCIPAAPGRPQPGFHCSMTAPICSTFSHPRVCVCALIVGGPHQICTTFPLWESHLWSYAKQLWQISCVHLKQTSGVKGTPKVDVQACVQWGKKPEQVFSWIYIWPLDMLNRNALCFYLELPCSCENSCQPNLNITQGQYLCAGTGTPLCCCVVGFGSSCHTTPRINNWKSVIPTLWSVRDVSASHLTEQNEGPFLTKRKSFSHFTALNVFLLFFHQWKEHQRFQKEMNTRQRLILLATFRKNIYHFKFFFFAHLRCVFG